MTLQKEVVLFVDYFNATQTSEVPRITAQILLATNHKVTILKKPAVTNGELLETDLDKWIEHARENVSKIQSTGIHTVIVVNPHEYVYFVKEYPKYLGSLPFEVVYVTDYLWELIKANEIKFKKKIELKASYHDPCTLNKMCNINESPRNIIKSIPGVEFINESPVTQWNYCCGNGTATFKRVHPDLAYRIGQTRLRRAADLQTDTLILACPHCKDHLTETQVKSGIDVKPIHLLEIMAEAMGID